MNYARPMDLVVFLRSLDEDLLLPALWLIRRSDLGAIVEDYDPEESVLELVEDRLFTGNRALYEFVVNRRAEN